jgi:hypothetical protein
MRAATAWIAIAGLAALALPMVAAGQSGDPPSGYDGNVTVFAALRNEVISLTTTIVVPDPPVRSPKHDGTVFLWPGLQPHPDYANFLPIDNGVLQPVLTWGPSCAPGVKPGGWWISPQYVNTVGDLMGYRGCFGGAIVAVNPKDELVISMSLEGTVWAQKVTNPKTTETTSFRTNLAGQAQAYARFQIEPHDGALGPDVTFLKTTIGFARPDPDNCELREKGTDDVVVARVLADDKQSCAFAKIVLKGPGVEPSARARTLPLRRQ